MKINQLPLYIFDFTTDQFTICQADDNKVKIIQIIPFALTLSIQMCEKLAQRFLSAQMKKNQKAATVENFNRIIHLMAYEKIFMDEIWKLFFSTHLTGIIDQVSQLYLIMPLAWEPLVSQSITDALTNYLAEARLTVLTDYFCVWFYHSKYGAEIDERHDVSNIYSYYVYQSKDQKVIYPLAEWSANTPVIHISCKKSDKTDPISPFVEGCHHYIFAGTIQPVVFDLHLSIGLLLNEEDFYPMCVPDLSYGQYMHQSIALKPYSHSVIQIMAALDHSKFADFYLMRMEIQNQTLDQHRPIDIHLCQLNALQGHLYITQTFNSGEQKIIGEQLFSLPRLTR